jgi:DNA primase
MIDNASIETLKSTVDIVDVVGNYVELKKAGANFKANCPFHGEKTPSLVVSPAKQIYHCFGCGAGGDSIKFVMEIEKLNYPEAVEKLASMVNFSLSYTKGSSNYADAKRVLELIGNWYVKNLEHQSTAKAYLQKRGITQASIEKFAIGYVADNNSVMQFLKSTLLPLPQAEIAGVIAESEQRRGYYARLVERITFPIFSSSGAIVGFGGRTITNHPAKYINSPQTKLFNKSRLLYGYHVAKESIYATKKLIVCEGYLDVIMFHQAGFTQAVATLGTALTSEHLPLLRKGEPKIILAYDGDKAGIAAALKAAHMLANAGFDGGVVLFPDGEDPADLIADEKSSEVAKLLREPKAFIPFVIEKNIEEYDLRDPRSKERAFNVVKSFLESLSQIIREAYIPFAATQLGISPTMFGSRNAAQQERPTTLRVKKEDIALLSILKTLIEKPEFITMVIDVVNATMCKSYEELFQTIIEERRDDPLFMGLELNETIQTMDEVELQDSLRKFLMKYYDEKLKELVGSEALSFDKKSFLIRKIKLDVIPRLKKGELVSYEMGS